MHVIYPALDEQNVKALVELRSEFELPNVRSNSRRMGENSCHNLSVYKNTRWFSWNRDQRQRFKDALPKKQWEKAVVGWFLDFPAKEGFLDRMTTWVNEVQSGTIIAYALRTNQSILINDEPVMVKKGEGIGFSLRNIHEIKRSQEGQLWACVMVLDSPDRYMP